MQLVECRMKKKEPPRAGIDLGGLLGPGMSADRQGSSQSLIASLLGGTFSSSLMNSDTGSSLVRGLFLTQKNRTHSPQTRKT